MAGLTLLTSKGFPGSTPMFPKDLITGLSVHDPKPPVSSYRYLSKSSKYLNG
jgi:hypothetical protein